MLIFANTPGVVGAVIAGPSLPFAVVVGGNPGTDAFPGAPLAKAVLTSFQVANRSGLGVAHTLRDRIYVYAFGEKAGQARVGGIAFAGVCGSAKRYTGFDAVYSYYERNRVSQQGFAVQLVFGPYTALAGFLSDFSFQLEDPQTGIGMFAFNFTTMPRNASFGLVPPAAWLL